MPQLQDKTVLQKIIRHRLHVGMKCLYTTHTALQNSLKTYMIQKYNWFFSCS